MDFVDLGPTAHAAQDHAFTFGGKDMLPVFSATTCDEGATLELHVILATPARLRAWPPTPVALDALAMAFVQHGFDFAARGAPVEQVASLLLDRLTMMLNAHINAQRPRRN